MNILYAVQSTGNGHLIRAKEIVPVLKKHARVDLMMSGYSGDIKLGFPVKYNYHGLSFIFGKNGNIDYLNSIKKFKPFTFLNDVRKCPVKSYDLIVSDFEPVSAWSSKLKGVPCVALSHQASFQSQLTPRPEKIEPFGESILKNYAPANKYIGVHFKKYDQAIETPIIRQEILDLHTREKDFVLVYLPAYSDEKLRSIFQQIPEINWRIYSKRSKLPYTYGNHIKVFPVGSENWLSSFADCYGVIMGAGFEGPSEAMSLGKRLLAVPMRDQYEQQCNAAALRNLGIQTVSDLNNPNIKEIIREWFKVKPTKLTFQNNSEKIVEKILAA